jgi:release factor glutamine methyltransferase
MQARPDLPAVWTVRDIVLWGREYFASKQIDEARRTIELMVCAVLSIRRLELYTDHERPLSKDELAQLRLMVQRRIKHEPLQYILGTADFFGLTFDVNPAVLIPRPETEILVDRLLRDVRADPGPKRCLDIGTGSGIIPVTVAVNAPTTQWTCMDISESALTCAHANADRHGVADRLMLVEGDFLDTIPAGGPWDVVTMNPPYIRLTDMSELEPEVGDYEPRQALTDSADGLTFYRRISELIGDLLAPSGRAYLEIGHGQADDVRQILEPVSASIDVYQDLGRIPRVFTIMRR